MQILVIILDNGKCNKILQFNLKLVFHMIFTAGPYINKLLQWIYKRVEIKCPLTPWLGGYGILDTQSLSVRGGFLVRYPVPRKKNPSPKNPGDKKFH